MSLEITPETQLLIEQEIRSGHFSSADELIVSGIRALHERDIDKHQSTGNRGRLTQFFQESPLVGLELDFPRDRDDGRSVDL